MLRVFMCSDWQCTTLECSPSTTACTPRRCSSSPTNFHGCVGVQCTAPSHQTLSFRSLCIFFQYTLPRYVTFCDTVTSDLPLEIVGTVINAYGAEKSPVMRALVVSDKPILTADLCVRLHTPASIVHLGLNSATTNTLEAEITTNLVECDNQDRPPWTLIGQRFAEWSAFVSSRRGR